MRQILIFERNVRELVLPVEKVSGLDADPRKPDLVNTGGGNIFLTIIIFV